MRTRFWVGTAFVLASCGGEKGDALQSTGSPNVAISVDPQSVYLPPGAVQRFTATVSGGNDRSVAWSVAEGAGGGTIAGDGTYTAPSDPGTFHVIARANADPAKSASATVYVSSTPVASISIDPAAADLMPGQTLQLHAFVTGVPDRSVLWSVREGAAGGSVDDTGLYTAPQTPGLYHAVAASHFDPTKTASAAISVSPGKVITVSIDPPSAALQPGETARFTARVTGTTDTAVTWSVAEAAGGTIDPSGVYTAPAAEGTFHVVATSHADPSKSAAAEVRVARLGQVKVVVSPASASVAAGGTVQFSATVTGSPDTRVEWSVAEGTAGGAITAGGLYTAPQTPGNRHVVATSLADKSRSAIAEVNVTPAGVAISLSPQTITVRPSEQVRFTATVTGSSDTRVQWQVGCCNARFVPDGPFSPGGTYTASPYDGTYDLTAQSLADPSKSATAKITVFSTSQITVQISPQSIAIYPGNGVAFTAHVTGTTDTAVTWSIRESADSGTIDANGVYKAPNKEGIFRILATSHADPSKIGTADVTVTWFNLIDRGGPVFPATRTYALWWGDASIFADVRPMQESVLRGFDGSAYLALADQYMRGARATTTFAGSLTSTTGTPNGGGAGPAACDALAAAGITPHPNDFVLVYGSIPEPDGTPFCAWHSSWSCGGVTVLMAWLPYPNSACSSYGRDVGCNAGTTNAKALALMTAHEFMEGITDPYGGAWSDLNLQEIADKCIGTVACYPLSTGNFQLQAQYSNAIHRCGP